MQKSRWLNFSNSCPKKEDFFVNKNPGAGSLLQSLRNVSLKIKLLGLYFFGLTLLGFIGYGFFIYLEVEQYAQDRQILQTQSRLFEKMAFDHLRYTSTCTTISLKFTARLTTAG